jgi:hypothetical protein
MMMMGAKSGVEMERVLVESWETAAEEQEPTHA